MSVETKQQRGLKRSFLEQQIARLAHRWPNLPWDAVLKAEYERVIGALFDTYGSAKVLQAVNLTIDSDEFLTPMGLNSHIPRDVRSTIPITEEKHQQIEAYRNSEQFEQDRANWHRLLLDLAAKVDMNKPVRTPLPTVGWEEEQKILGRYIKKVQP